ncbi:hypothetical protein EV1_019046 [Malus domestica]
MRRFEGHVCPEEDADDGCSIIDKVFDDEPLFYHEDTLVDDVIKFSLRKDVKLLFLSAVNMAEDEGLENEDTGHGIEEEGPDEEGWTTVILKRHSIRGHPRHSWDKVT